MQSKSEIVPPVAGRLTPLYLETFRRFRTNVAYVTVIQTAVTALRCSRPHQGKRDGAVDGAARGKVVAGVRRGALVAVGVSCPSPRRRHHSVPRPRSSPAHLPPAHASVPAVSAARLRHLRRRAGESAQCRKIIISRVCFHNVASTFVVR